MKKKIIILFAGLAFISTTTLAQKTDSLKQEDKSYLNREVKMDREKATQVQSIMDNYKQNLKALLSQNKLSDADKRAKYNILIDEKNLKLKKIVNNEQFDQIVPTTERQISETIIK